MAASFPGAVKSFTRQVDGVSTMDAVDVNAAYDEIEAIETMLRTPGSQLSPATVITIDDTPTPLIVVPTPDSQATLIDGYIVYYVENLTSVNGLILALLYVINGEDLVGGFSAGLPEGWAITTNLEYLTLTILVKGPAATRVVWTYFSKGI